MAMVSGDVWQAFEAARLAHRGSWPNAGGWLDQPRVLLDSIKAIRFAESNFKTRSPLAPDEDDD